MGTLAPCPHGGCKRIPVCRSTSFGLLTILLASALSTCTVGPDYVKQDPILPARFQADHDTSGAVRRPAPGYDWWKEFDDPQLNELIARAVKEAPTLSAAEARIRSARALRSIAGTADFPDLNLSAGYDRSHGSNNVPTGVPPGGLGPGITSNLWQAGFDSSWELDIFGASRRSVEAASADLQAYEFDLNDIRLTLIAEIIRTDMEARTAGLRLNVAESVRKTEEERRDLIQSLVRAGLASSLDFYAARARVEAAAAAIPAIEGDLRTARFRMAALVGCTPDELPAQFPTSEPLPEPVLSFSAGLPSDLLRRRPDLRAAERRLAAANARIGVAQADLYPHFSLTAIAGLESLQLSTFHTGSSGYYAIGPGLGWNIFDAGKIHFEVMDATARKEAGVAMYRSAVLNALRDAEVALEHVGNTQIRLQALDRERSAYRDSAVDAKMLYLKGIESYLPSVDTEIALYQSTDRYILAKQDALLALVGLYKSIGGDWASEDTSSSLPKKTK